MAWRLGGLAVSVNVTKNINVNINVKGGNSLRHRSQPRRHRRRHGAKKCQDMPRAPRRIFARMGIEQMQASEGGVRGGRDLVGAVGKLGKLGKLGLSCGRCDHNASVWKSGSTESWSRTVLDCFCCTLDRRRYCHYHAPITACRRVTVSLSCVISFVIAKSQFRNIIKCLAQLPRARQNVAFGSAPQ